MRAVDKTRPLHIADYLDHTAPFNRARGSMRSFCGGAGHLWSRSALARFDALECFDRRNRSVSCAQVSWPARHCLLRTSERPLVSIDGLGCTRPCDSTAPSHDRAWLTQSDWFIGDCVAYLGIPTHRRFSCQMCYLRATPAGEMKLRQGKCYLVQNGLGCVATDQCEKQHPPRGVRSGVRSHWLAGPLPRTCTSCTRPRSYTVYRRPRGLSYVVARSATATTTTAGCLVRLRSMCFISRRRVHYERARSPCIIPW